MIVFLNGQFVPEAEALVPANDRGFMLGDGLFETLRVMNGKPFRMTQHLERMSRGAVFLRITPPFTPKELENFARNLIKKNQMPDAVLRMTLTRGPGGRGYSPQGVECPLLVMTLHPLPLLKPPAGWSLITSPFRIPTGDVLSSFKTTSKIWQVMARFEAVEKGANEALLLNTNGEVAEAAGGNIFWVARDQICTVPADRGILPGITRAIVLEICQSLGLTTNKRVIKPEALRSASGIFITQSVLGIVPVASLDGNPVAPSPLTDQIAGVYNEMLARESA